jgi:hypothetical protein
LLSSNRQAGGFGVTPARFQHEVAIQAKTYVGKSVRTRPKEDQTTEAWRASRILSIESIKASSVRIATMRENANRLKNLQA